MEAWIGCHFGKVNLLTLGHCFQLQGLFILSIFTPAPPYAPRLEDVDLKPPLVLLFKMNLLVVFFALFSGEVVVVCGGLLVVCSLLADIVLQFRQFGVALSDTTNDAHLRLLSTIWPTIYFQVYRILQPVNECSAARTLVSCHDNNKHDHRVTMIIVGALSSRGKVLPTFPAQHWHFFVCQPSLFPG